MKHERITHDPNGVFGLLVMGFVAALIVWMLLSTVIAVARVDGQSMEPCLSDGDTVVCIRHSYGFGDVVLFYDGKQIMVKRIAGMAGDSVAVKDGKLYRNGELCNEPYAWQDPESEYDREMDLSVVPEGYVFVLGDNRGHSRDSRDPGLRFIPAENIIGKLWFRIGN